VSRFSAKLHAARRIHPPAGPHGHDRPAKRNAPAATPTPREPPTAHHRSAWRSQPPVSIWQTSFPPTRHPTLRPRRATPGPQNAICPPQPVRPENRTPRTTPTAGAASPSPARGGAAIRARARRPAPSRPAPPCSTRKRQSARRNPYAQRTTLRPVPRHASPPASRQRLANQPLGQAPTGSPDPAPRRPARKTQSARRNPYAQRTTLRHRPGAQRQQPSTSARPPSRQPPSPPSNGLHRSTKRRQMPAPYGGGER
jgi:hypothetical protein